MGQPWGLSGPQFLQVYFGAIVVAAIIPFLVYKLARREPAPRGSKRRLNAFEAACLKGGADRVSQVAMAELTSSGALRVISSGLAMVSDREAWSRTQTASVLGIEADDFPVSGTTAGGFKRVRQSPGVRRLRRKLESDGLAHSAIGESVPRAVTVILVAALLGLGIARLIEGISNGRPTRDLDFLLFIAVAESLWLLKKFTGLVARPTPRGSACLAPVPDQASEAQNSSDAATLMTGTMLGVALAGLSAVPESILRSVLRAGMPMTAESVLGSMFSGGISGSGSGGGMGHTCGGGSSCGGGSGGGGGGCGG